MPLRVRLKLILIFALLALLVGWLFSISWLVGAAFAALVLLYIEMIYPKWNFFGSAILDVKSKGPKACAITFDDGPSAWTKPILETLKAENVKATFFLLGANVDRFPEIARQIQEDGHQIGYHGYSHTKFHFKSREFIRRDLDACKESFERAGLKSSELIRFPHGFKNVFATREARARSLKLCGWGRGVWDSKRPGVNAIVERSLKLRAGEILLLHDGDGAKENPDRSQTAEALPKIIQGLRAKGFDFVTI